MKERENFSHCKIWCPDHVMVTSSIIAHILITPEWTEIRLTYRDKYLSNNTGTTHYDSLQGSFWSDQKNSHNEVIMTSLLGQ